MKIQFSFFLLLSTVFLASCGSKKGPQWIANSKKIILTPTKNKDGTYSTLRGKWTVPNRVYAVKIIGCSGGNGGGGGGAGGEGAGLFAGSWADSSLGGNGTAGGDANGEIGSGEKGTLGKAGMVCNPHCNPLSNDPGRLHPANSASISGENGKLGDQTEFGEFKFLPAAKNKENIQNNINLSSLLKNFKDYCEGGEGGLGGKGGVGANGHKPNIEMKGGFGGNGGNGKEGYSSIVQEETVYVQPGQEISYLVGAGGMGGKRSPQYFPGQGSRHYENAHPNSPGTNGDSGKPGVLILQWAGVEEL